MRRAFLALGAMVLLAGCGGGPIADDFIVYRSGTVPGASLKLRIADDGGAYCNSSGTRHEITSAQLISARDIRRRLDGDENADGFTDAEKDGIARRDLRLPPRGDSFYVFKVRSEEGTIVFSENSVSKDTTVMPRIVKLTRDIARESCGLAR